MDNKLDKRLSDERKSRASRYRADDRKKLKGEKRKEAAKSEAMSLPDSKPRKSSKSKQSQSQRINALRHLKDG